MCAPTHPGPNSRRMIQRTHFAGFLLLFAAAATFAQVQPNGAKAPKPPPRVAAKNPALKNTLPKNADGTPKPGPRLGTPGNPVERLMAMPPEKREQVLERLPPKQQANLRERLDRFDKLPAAERARLNQMWNTFNSLPPEKQESVTRQMQAFNGLPDARRQELRPVLQRLRTMPAERRTKLLNSEDFKSRFSPAELEMLTEISQNYPLPGR